MVEATTRTGTPFRSILAKSGLASRVKNPHSFLAAPLGLLLCSFLSLKQGVQLRRLNDVVERRVFRWSGRGQCPEMPRGFLWQARPETPHRFSDATACYPGARDFPGRRFAHSW